VKKSFREGKTKVAGIPGVRFVPANTKEVLERVETFRDRTRLAQQRDAMKNIAYNLDFLNPNKKEDTPTAALPANTNPPNSTGRKTIAGGGGISLSAEAHTPPPFRI
jgi:hypothetical protein